MKYVKDFNGWRSEEIVKVFLLNIGIFELSDSLSNVDKGIDILAICKKNYDFKFGITIKATKYSKKSIQTKFSNLDIDFSYPIIQFFINYDTEKGYFRIIKNQQYSEIEIMSKEKFIDTVKNYAQQCV